MTLDSCLITLSFIARLSCLLQAADRVGHPLILIRRFRSVGSRCRLICQRWLNLEDGHVQLTVCASMLDHSRACLSVVVEGEAPDLKYSSPKVASHLPQPAHLHGLPRLSLPPTTILSVDLPFATMTALLDRYSPSSAYQLPQDTIEISADTQQAAHVLVVCGMAKSRDQKEARRLGSVRGSRRACLGGLVWVCSNLAVKN
jgi:hypothetical protein